jgi:acetyl esterase/lipase
MDILALILSLLPLLCFSLFIQVKEERSTSSFISEQLLKLRIKQSLVPVSRSLAQFEERNSKPYTLPKGLSVLIDYTQTSFKGMPVYTLGKNNAEKVVLYFHGGAYVEQPLLAHWIFLERLVKLTDCQIIVPIYPKAPTHTVLDVMPLLLDLYQSLQHHDIVLMGDSAGGGLALSLAQLLNTKALSMPDSLILISPWLDISMSNKAIGYLQKRDPMLDMQMLKICADAYRGSVSSKDPLVSPLYGSLKNLCPITLFVGTHELFLSEARLLQNRAKEDGATLEYHEKKRMNHDYVLFPIPEAARARMIIAQHIKGEHT